jgi:pyrimidine operon attenuation protein/uracil phosphoribosyltransferase
MRTDIRFDIDGATIILADDVLFSGRTLRAALNELFDHGRPQRVELAALVDRGGRSLPVTADYVGLRVAANAAQQVVVRLSEDPSPQDSVHVEPAG